MSVPRVGRHLGDRPGITQDGNMLERDGPIPLSGHHLPAADSGYPHANRGAEMHQHR